MTKNKLPVRFTGQHFTIDKVLIADAIKFAEISEYDTVLDIGAGRGYLTDYIINHCSRVIAIENDKSLSCILQKKFARNSKVRLIENDFRKYSLPASSFKVVSSIPYRITSDILKTLMFENVNSFLGGSLILQLESARKLTSNKKFNPFNVLYNSFYDLKLVYEIHPDSFLPPPKVNSALLCIVKKKNSKVDIHFKAKYLQFLFFVLKNPDTPASTVLKKLFRKKQLRYMSDKYNLNLNLKKVVDINPLQWSECFYEMLKIVPERFHP